MYDSQRDLSQEQRPVRAESGLKLLGPSLLLLLAACTATPTPICPAIVEYTRAEQLQASKDLDLLPDTSPVHRFMGDYKQLRARNRECQP